MLQDKEDNSGRIQTSETFMLGAVLSFSGGLQDAYTYFLRDNVFANAQTGNIILMSSSFMKGDVPYGMKYLFPVISFILGILVAEQIGARYKSSGKLHWRQIILLLEILILGIVGFLPRGYNMLANILVSFACSMQVQAFRTMHGYGYATTMCIGNLRSGTESLSVFLRRKEKKYLNKAVQYYGIIAVFALGAGIGSILSRILGFSTIWICCVLLTAACLMMQKKYR